MAIMINIAATPHQIYLFFIQKLVKIKITIIYLQIKCKSRAYIRRNKNIISAIALQLEKQDCLFFFQQSMCKNRLSVCYSICIRLLGNVVVYRYLTLFNGFYIENFIDKY